ncbi:MAG: DNA polymerase III subunit epsilon [Gammaproteobacteria bacterium]
MRQVVLDAETTGLEPHTGHRIIEIGCVEIVNRRVSDRRFHRYLHPDRDIDEGAAQVHGITLEDLEASPRFAEIAAEFLQFVRGAEVIIHNAAFDLGFLDHELMLAGPEWGRFGDHCTVVDTLALAREKHPGQKNSLDALCKRYQVDNAARTLHGALLDAEILADVYLAMTGGQATLLLEEESQASPGADVSRRGAARRVSLRVIAPSLSESAEHQRLLDLLDKESGGRCVWRHSGPVPDAAQDARGARG